MNIDTSKISKLQLYSTIAMLVAGLWLIIEIFRGDISFSANWNMFKSPLGNICLGIGFIMAMIWWGRFGHWTQTTIRETRDSYGNVVKREKNFDVATSVFDSIAVPLLGHFILEPIVYGALIYYPIQCLIAIVGAVFPYVVILLVLALIAGTWLLADRFTDKRRKAFILSVALMSAAMAGLAGYLHWSGNEASQSVAEPKVESVEILESVDPAPKSQGKTTNFELKEDGIYNGDYSVKLGDKITDLPETMGCIYDSFETSVSENMDGDETVDIVFKLGNNEMFYATSYDKSTIAWITIMSSSIRFKLGDKYYGVGDCFPEEEKKNDLDWDDIEGGMYLYKGYTIPYDSDQDCIVSINIGEAPF